MTIADLYPLSQETLQALDAHYRPAMQQALADAGLEGRHWGVLLFTQGVEPQPLSAARRRKSHGRTAGCCWNPSPPPP